MVVANIPESDIVPRRSVIKAHGPVSRDRIIATFIGVGAGEIITTKASGSHDDHTLKYDA